jgi:hypothetical protein
MMDIVSPIRRRQGSRRPHPALPQPETSPGRIDCCSAVLSRRKKFGKLRKDRKQKKDAATGFCLLLVLIAAKTTIGLAFWADAAGP